MNTAQNQKTFPGHFAQRDYGLFNPTTAWLGKLVTGQDIRPSNEQYAAFGHMTWEGDPKADAVVDWFRDVGFKRGRMLLEQALDDGIDTVKDAPEALKALMAEVDNPPQWLDRSKLDLAARTIHRTGPIGFLVLGDIALMGGYAISSVMNKSLVFTGALESGAAARLRETARWWLDTTATGGLDRFGKGTRTSTIVRVMHAMVRVRLKAHPDWDYEEYGMPISQAHMLATNNAFSVLFIHACQALGVRFTKAERNAIMHMWRYVALLNGVDARYVSESELEGFQAIWMSATTQPPPDEDARALARGLAEVSPFDRMGGDIPDWAQSYLRDALGSARLGLTHMLGDQIYNDLELPKGKSWRWFPLALRGGVLAAETARRLAPGGTALAERLGRQIQEGGFSQLEEENADAAFVPVDVLAKDKKKAAAA